MLNPSIGPLLLLVGCALAPFARAQSAKTSKVRPPNIVILFTDDQGYGDLGCYGSTTIRTPRIDQLAKEGTRFTSCYVQVVCGPSRSALLTGRYPVRSHGWSMAASEVTIAERLETVGYTTGCIGKWDVSNRRAIGDRMPNAQGFDYYWGTLGANDSGRVRFHHNNEPDGATTDMASLSRIYTDKGIAFMEAHKDRPFLLYLAHTMVHSVIDASPAFKGRSKGGLYGDTIEELDYHTGRLLDAIDELGLRDDTIVVFLSDNGPWNNMQKILRRKHKGAIAWGSSGPLREGKGSTYEGGVRVPCIVRWPGHVPAGRVSDAILASIDLMPTLATLADYEVPDDRILDGVDQTPLWLGKSATGARDNYFYFCRNELQAVRKGKWKLRLPDLKVYYGYVKDRGSKDFELYDLQADVGEHDNLAGQQPAVVAELRALAQSFVPPKIRLDDHSIDARGPKKRQGRGRAQDKDRARNSKDPWWPAWRGPAGTGCTPSGNPPTEWSETKNIKWKVAIPGTGISSPIVWRDRIYLTTAIATDRHGTIDGDLEPQSRLALPRPTVVYEFRVLAVDRRNGQLIWNRKVTAAVPHEGGHRTNTHASNSPITDGTHVYANFGSQGIYCLDLAGKVLWSEKLGVMRTRRQYGEASSPALFGDRLVINWDHEGASFLAVFDKHSGKELWRRPRDEVTSWSTPIVIPVDGRPQIIINATNATRGYDLASGEVLWSLAGMTVNCIPHPVYADGVAFVMSGYRGDTLQAIRLSGARGDLAGSKHVVWAHHRNASYVPSAALLGGCIYFLRKNSAVLSCLDAKTGAVHYEGQRLRGLRSVYASPVGAAGHLYVTSRDGVTRVVEHGPAFAELATNRLDDEVDASLAIVGDEIYLRGRRHLYCIAKTGSPQPKAKPKAKAAPTFHTWRSVRCARRCTEHWPRTTSYTPNMTAN